MSQKPTSPSTFRNSTCRNVGHDWQIGLDQRYRTCQREHCQAAQRLIDSHWVEVCSRQARTHHQSQEVTGSSLLWSTTLFNHLHTGWPPPGYNPVEERRAEQRYYKAVADERLYRAMRVPKGGH